MAFALHVSSHGIDINSVGVILMVVGGIGLLVALAVSGFGGRRRTATVVHDGEMVRPGRVVRETYLD